MGKTAENKQTRYNKSQASFDLQGSGPKAHIACQYKLFIQLQEKSYSLHQ